MENPPSIQYLIAHITIVGVFHLNHSLQIKRIVSFKQIVSFEILNKCWF